MCRASASHATLELPTLVECVEAPRVAENGSLSARAQLAVQIFIKRVFTIFATNASFLRIIANLGTFFARRFPQSA